VRSAGRTQVELRIKANGPDFALRYEANAAPDIRNPTTGRHASGFFRSLWLQRAAWHRTGMKNIAHRLKARFARVSKKTNPRSGRHKRIRPGAHQLTEPPKHKCNPVFFLKTRVPRDGPLVSAGRHASLARFAFLSTAPSGTLVSAMNAGVPAGVWAFLLRMARA